MNIFKRWPRGFLLTVSPNLQSQEKDLYEVSKMAKKNYDTSKHSNNLMSQSSHLQDLWPLQWLTSNIVIEKKIPYSNLWEREWMFYFQFDLQISFHLFWQFIFCHSIFNNPIGEWKHVFTLQLARSLHSRHVLTMVHQTWLLKVAQLIVELALKEI